MKTKLNTSKFIDLLFEFAAVSVFGGAFLVGGGVLAIIRSVGIHVSLNFQYLFIFMVWLLVSWMWMFWRVKRYRRMEVWELTGDQLRRGAPVNLKVDLSTVEQAILGLPKTRRYRAIAKQKMRLAEQSKLKSIYDCTIVLKLNSSQYLPLYLAELGGGLEIMNKVLHLVSEKLQRNYHYNEGGHKLLKPRKLNSVVTLPSMNRADGL